MRLIEIPTPDETHDNIVAFWTPDAKVDAASELRVAYGLIWSLAGPLDTGLARVVDTRIGTPDGHPGSDTGLPAHRHRLRAAERRPAARHRCRGTFGVHREFKGGSNRPK